MENVSYIAILAGVTFTAVIAFAAWQFFTTRSQRGKDMRGPINDYVDRELR